MERLLSGAHHGPGDVVRHVPHGAWPCTFCQVPARGEGHPIICVVVLAQPGAGSRSPVVVGVAQLGDGPVVVADFAGQKTVEDVARGIIGATQIDVCVNARGRGQIAVVVEFGLGDIAVDVQRLFRLCSDTRRPGRGSSARIGCGCGYFGTTRKPRRLRYLARKKGSAREFVRRCHFTRLSSRCKPR